MFAGTPVFAAYHLNALIQANYNIIGVLTKPDQFTGRKRQLTDNPVKKLANIHQILILQPVSLHNENLRQKLLMLRMDILIVVAYGLILPQYILDIPPLGCINVHGSLLPRWRGPAPIPRALLAGDRETGITIIKLDSSIDTGAIILRVPYEIKSQDTSDDLYHILSKIGVKALLMTLDKIIFDKDYIMEKQNDAQATYAAKIIKTEAKLNWILSAVQLDLCIRAFNPWPVSYFMHFGHHIKVWQAKVSKHWLGSESIMPGTIVEANKTGIYVTTGNGVIVITLLQLSGKRIISALDLLNARKEWFIPGTIIN